MPYLFAAAGKLSALRGAVQRAGEENPNDPDLNERLVGGLGEAARWVDESRSVARRLMDGISYPPRAVENPLLAAADFLESVLDLDAMPDPPNIRWPWHDSVPDQNDDGLQRRPQQSSPPAGVFSPATAVAIYRLTSEAVRNAVRHAAARTIEISVEHCPTLTIIEIEDDGCGFDRSKIDSEHLHGLVLAEHRAAAAGIRWELESCGTLGSKLATGTRITLKVTA